jgi:hypothetical protein
MNKIKNNMKKSFTLLEVLISISLFAIITIFLYQSLDITKKSNDFYSSKLEIKQDENRLKKLFFLDFINKSNKKNSLLKITKDNDENNIIQLQSTNIYHNPFYTNITYLVSKEKNLIRIESKNIFNPKKLNDSFFDTAYVDIIYQGVKELKVKKIDKDILIYINTIEDEKIFMRL